MLIWPPDHVRRGLYTCGLVGIRLFPHECKGPSRTIFLALSACVPMLLPTRSPRRVKLRPKISQMVALPR